MRSNSTIRRRRAVLVVAATAALLAAALLTSVSATGQGNHRVHRRGKAVRVAIKGFAYHPRTLRVRRGTKLVFANNDSTTHTATRKGSFDTGNIRPGHAAVVKLGRPGVYVYHCTIHPFMRGKIVVR